MAQRNGTSAVTKLPKQCCKLSKIIALFSKHQSLATLKSAILHIRMKQRWQTLKQFVIDHKKDVIIDGSIGLGIVLIVILVLVFIYNNQPPVIVYEPADACKMLTLTEAKTLLGDQAVNGTDTGIIVSKENNATSQCSYSDLNTDADSVKVAAVSIQSGINNAGTTTNNTDFANAAKGNVSVTDLGHTAFFNKANGQLDILDGHNWIIVSFGIGNSPSDNTQSDDETLAKLVLN